MTLAEFVLAFDGYCESKGIKKSKDSRVTRNEYLDMVSRWGG